MPNERVFLGLGSNMGDRRTYIERAVECLVDAGVRLIRGSSVYETEPVGGPSGQSPYLNAVLEASVSVSVRDMLVLCKKIEKELGRQPGPRWGPRPIDIDILLWNDQIIDEPDLKIPHIEMANRAFVLAPMDEIVPEVYNPRVARSIHELALQLPESEAVERLSGSVVWKQREPERSGGRSGQD